MDLIFCYSCSSTLELSNALADYLRNRNTREVIRGTATPCVVRLTTHKCGSLHPIAHPSILNPLGVFHLPPYLALGYLISTVLGSATYYITDIGSDSHMEEGNRET